MTTLTLKIIQHRDGGVHMELHPGHDENKQAVEVQIMALLRPIIAQAISDATQGRLHNEDYTKDNPNPFIPHPPS